jgi:hypothetical protein
MGRISPPHRSRNRQPRLDIGAVRTQSERRTGAGGTAERRVTHQRRDTPSRAATASRTACPTGRDAKPQHPPAKLRKSSDNEVPQHKKASWWRDGRTIVPIGISVIALVLAGLTYVDQHNVDVAAVTASQEAYARLVSYYESTNGSSTMVVENLGQQPIFNIQAQVWLIYHGGTTSQQQLTATYETAELPPCSDTMINFHDPGFLGSLEEYSVGNTKLLFKTGKQH